MTEIHSLRDLEQLEAQVNRSVQRTLDALPTIIAACTPIEAFTRLKFEQLGFHPIEDRSLNIIEQLNQTFSYFASLRAARWIIENHESVLPLRLNLGAAGGF